MELNLNCSLGSSGHKAKVMIRPKDVSSWPLIAMSPWDQWPRLFLTSLNVILCDGKRHTWFFEKFLLFRPPFHVPFVSWCSWCISASIECLKSNFDREIRKKSHLELQFSSSETRNEKPCIPRLIGSFWRLIWVTLHFFHLNLSSFSVNFTF